MHVIARCYTRRCCCERTEQEGQGYHCTRAELSREPIRECVSEACDGHGCELQAALRGVTEQHVECEVAEPFWIAP